MWRYHNYHFQPRANRFPGGGQMDIIGEIVLRLFSELRPLLEWALSNWLITLLVLGVLIFGAGKYRRPYRRHS